jgi:hypothetical protein
MRIQWIPGILAIMTLILSSCGNLAGPDPQGPDPQGQAAVPAELQFPAGERVLLRAEAKGVQIYQCKTNAQNAARLEWTFVAPEADLSDANGKPVGKHYAGPTWEASDGSKVVGEVRAHTEAPDANAIPWLLLSAKSTSGTGTFANVTHIQRIDTVGGKAPESCRNVDAGRTLSVPYSATYIFSVGK